MDLELGKSISRLRRAMPRNADVMALCDELERRFSIPDAKAAECPECERRRAQTRARVKKVRAKK